MNNLGNIQLSHHAYSPGSRSLQPDSLNRAPKAQPNECSDLASQDSTRIGSKISDLTGDTIRSVGGTAAVALKSSSLVTSSVLQGFGMEEKKADRFGTVASIVSLGTTMPLAIMGSGVVGTLAVKGLGLGQGAEPEHDRGRLSEMKTAYVSGVNEAFSDGQFLADGVIGGVKAASTATGEKLSDLGKTAASGFGKALDSGLEVTTGVVEDVGAAAKGAFDFTTSWWRSDSL